MKERQKDQTVRKIVKRGLLFFLVLLIVLGFFGYRYITKSLEPMNENSEDVVEIEVPMGATRGTISQILAENDLINNQRIFELYIKFASDNDFQAGSYLMSPSMSVKEIAESLNKGETPIVEEPTGYVTIPEGIQLEEIAERVDTNTEFSKEEFMDLIEDSSFIEEAVDTYPFLLTDAKEAEDETRYVLEGYLFPATYEVQDEKTLEEAVLEMIAEMNSVVENYETEIEESDWNVHELLTLASYIEKEGVSFEDREKISGVFYNRLEEDMPLQTDPSVSYALGEHRERTSHKDLEVDSPYNTYKNKGIGAGPINSPSAEAIQAAIEPIETDYMYFLADLDTGKIYYSETYEEHLEYQNKYLRDND